MTLAATTLLTQTIERLAFGGMGVSRHEGQVVFTPGTAPGDIALVRIRDVKKKYAIAELVEVVRPGPGRIAAPCPYRDRCSGCPIQHLSYDEQFAYKRGALEDALIRIAKAPSPLSILEHRADKRFYYRRRIRLNVSCSPSAWHLGYMEREERALLEVDHCPLFTKPEQSPLVQLRELFQSLPLQPGREGWVTLLKAGDSFALHFQWKGQMPKGFSEFVKRLPYPFVATAKDRVIRGGNATGTVVMGDLAFTFAADAFVQNHPEAGRLYEATVLEAGSATCALDLYCGTGILTLLLGQSIPQVVGIEESASAIRAAKANSQQNKMPRVTFRCGRVETLLASAIKREKPDLIVVNPPRTGLSEAVASRLNRSGAQTLLYISCMPATLARDLIRLNAYTFSHAHLFDLFPQTAHLETLAVLQIH